MKGLLTFSDLFGELKFALNVTINDGMTPGRPHRTPGTGFSYNQFIDEHQWMVTTELSDMICALENVHVIYADGSTENPIGRS